MRNTIVLLSLILLPAVALAEAPSKDFWNAIETNLPSTHPCAWAGGTWRGWCMDLSRFSPKIPRLAVTGGSRNSHNETTVPCRDFTPRSERRACFRAENLRRWGQ